jgi:hypothetical protein
VWWWWPQGCEKVVLLSLEENAFLCRKILILAPGHFTNHSSNLGFCIITSNKTRLCKIDDKAKVLLFFIFLNKSFILFDILLQCNILLYIVAVLPLVGWLQIFLHAPIQLVE